MAMTRLAAMCGALLLTTGLCLGVGWAAAGTDSDEGGSPLASSAPAATQPAGAPIRVVQEKDKKPPMQADALRHQSEAISRRIDELRARIAQETPDDGMVDVSVLQAELYAVDRRVLQAEKLIKTEERGLEQSIKSKDAVAKMVINKSDIAAVLDQDPDVRKAITRLSKANQAVVVVKTMVTGDEHPVVRAATKEVLDAEAALKSAREKASPTAERQIRDNLVRDYDSHAIRYKERIENEMTSLAELRDTRKKLAMRIAEVRQGESRRLSLQDELKVLREIQLELIRLRTISELGIEGLHPAMRRTETDPKVEVQFTEMRREIEVLRAEVEKLRKKN